MAPTWIQIIFQDRRIILFTSAHLLPRVPSSRWWKWSVLPWSSRCARSSLQDAEKCKGKILKLPMETKVFPFTSRFLDLIDSEQFLIQPYGILNFYPGELNVRIDEIPPDAVRYFLHLIVRLPITTDVLDFPRGEMLQRFRSGAAFDTFYPRDQSFTVTNERNDSRLAVLLFRPIELALFQNVSVFLTFNVDGEQNGFRATRQAWTLSRQCSTRGEARFTRITRK